MRNLADEALRSRMDAEMQETLGRMEDQIQRFQAEVDHRLEEQEKHVRRVVEERVQQELDSELAKVQQMVEERVRERVGSVLRREVRETIREAQARLTFLAGENDVLRDAFAEANLRAKSLFWAVHPSMSQVTSAGSVGLVKLALSWESRAMLACSWHDGVPPLREGALFITPGASLGAPHTSSALQAASVPPQPTVVVEAAPTATLEAVLGSTPPQVLEPPLPVVPQV